MIIKPDEGWATVLLTSQNAFLTGSRPIGELGWAVGGMMMGKEPFRPAGMYWKRNGIVAGIVVVLAATLVAWFVYLRTTRHALVLGRPGALPVVIMTGLASVLVAGAVLLLGPGQWDHGNWAIALPNRPDLA